MLSDFVFTANLLNAFTVHCSACNAHCNNYLSYFVEFWQHFKCVCKVQIIQFSSSFVLTRAYN